MKKKRRGREDGEKGIGGKMESREEEKGRGGEGEERREGQIRGR